jgi:hypothetical protein
VKYYKVWYTLESRYEHYRKYEDNSYDFYSLKERGWYDGGDWSVKKRYCKIVEISKLEILIALGPEAVKEDK